ncbi:MAG: chloride channel protein [Deltaproteobacteria bacterium]|nr:chloride channel protein [Deltaproteobacteria bacterium]
MSARRERGRPAAQETIPSVAGWRRLASFLGPEEEQWGSLLLLALGVGVLSGASAVGLRSAVHALFHGLAPLRDGWLGPLLPAFGAALGAAIVLQLFREPPGHGVPEVIRAVCRDGGRMRRRSIFSRWLGSLCNVASGGSAGLESPIVFSAAAIGSTVGGWLQLDERRRTLLLACGVAGGISAVFNAPMTGMIFAMEVVLAEWSAFAIVPVVMSAVAATELSRIVLGDAQSILHAPFDMGARDLLACALLGIVAGLVSAVFTRTIALFQGLAARIRGHRILAPALFGLLVGVIGIVAPGAIGEGYDTARAAIHSELAPGLLFCALLVFAKLVTTGLTIGSGAPGGVFAPCLVLGSLLGVGFSRVLGVLLPDTLSLSVEGSYALVAMSGLVAGVMQAPLTGIFLVMEVTDGYEVILPLMIVSVLSLVVKRRFDRYSMYTHELAESGDLLRPGTDRRILADVSVRETLDQDVTPISEDMTLLDFAEVLKTSHRNHFPVLRSGSDEFAGMLELAPIREILLDPEMARVTLVGTMMDSDTPTIPLEASLAEALSLFEQTGAWALPVVDGRRFSGLLSKSSLFDHYRRELSVQAPR